MLFHHRDLTRCSYNILLQGLWNAKESVPHARAGGVVTRFWSPATIAIWTCRTAPFTTGSIDYRLKSDLTPSSITLHQNRLLFFTGQEKAAIMGWNPAKLDSADLTARELGLALGNAWALPVSMRLVKQLNECMGWQSWSDDQCWQRNAVMLPWLRLAPKEMLISHCALTVLMKCHFWYQKQILL